VKLLDLELYRRHTQDLIHRCAEISFLLQKHVQKLMEDWVEFLPNLLERRMDDLVYHYLQETVKKMTSTKHKLKGIIESESIKSTYRKRVTLKGSSKSTQFIEDATEHPSV
jgi:hypothetical protein